MSSSILPKVTNGDVIMVEKEDFLRLEGKVNNIVEALNKLVLVEERQLTQGERLGKLEAELAAEKEKRDTQVGNLKEAIAATNNSLDKWVQRGIGLWGALVLVIAGFKFWVQFIK